MTPLMEDCSRWLTMVGGRKVDAEDGGTKGESFEDKGDDKEREEDDTTFGNGLLMILTLLLLLEMINTLNNFNFS